MFLHFNYTFVVVKLLGDEGCLSQHSDLATAWRSNNHALISAATSGFSLLHGPDRLWGLLSFLLNSYRGALFSNFFITY